MVSRFLCPKRSDRREISPHFSMKMFQLASDTAGGDGVSVAVQKDAAFISAGGLEPPGGIFLQLFWDIDTPLLIAFGINIFITGIDILCLKLNDLTDPGPGGCHKSDNKIIEVLFVAEKAFFQIFVIGLADYIVQIGFLLDSNHGDMAWVESLKFDVGVHSANAQIDRLGFVVFQKINFIKFEIGMSNFRIKGKELADCTCVGVRRIFRHVS